VVLNVSFFFFFSFCTSYSRIVFWHSWASSIPVASKNRPNPLSADNRFGSPAMVELLLRKNGIKLFSQLKQQDTALANITPNVTLSCFGVLFGG
jgi:hypothetical protein